MILMVVMTLSTVVSAAGTSWKSVDTSNFDSAQDKSNAANAVQNVIGAIITVAQVVRYGCCYHYAYRNGY